LTLTASDAFRYAIKNLGSVPGFMLCLFFALAPFALVWRERVWKRVASPTALLLSASLISMLIPFAFAADWGRYIHLLMMNLFVLALLSSSPDSKRIAESWLTTSGLLFGLLYLTSWQMVHFARPGKSAFRPGLIFQTFAF
jgi:hypothetical protein